MPRVRDKALDELLEGKTTVELAKAWGISRKTLWQVRKGAPVGTKTLAAFKKAYPDKSIEYYFDFGV